MLGVFYLSKGPLRLIIPAMALIGMMWPLSALAGEPLASCGRTPLTPPLVPLSFSPRVSADRAVGTSSASSSFRIGGEDEIPRATYAERLNYALAGFAVDLARDYSTQITFPVRFARRDPVGLLIGAAGIGTLIATDEATYDLLVPDDLSEDDALYKAAEKLTKLGNTSSSVPLLLGFFGFGAIAHSERERDTAVMMCEALITSATWTGILKQTTGRERPRESGGEASDWLGPGGSFEDENGNTVEPRSFPSGHATGAWAVATVLAHQYPAHKIVPVLAYGTAAAVGYSRIVLGAHWLSDVVVGGLIGYGCAKQVMTAHDDKRLKSENEGLHVGAYVSGDARGVSLRYGF